MSFHYDRTTGTRVPAEIHAIAIGLGEIRDGNGSAEELLAAQEELATFLTHMMGLSAVFIQVIERERTGDGEASEVMFASVQSLIEHLAEYAIRRCIHEPTGWELWVMQEYNFLCSSWDQVLSLREMSGVAM